MTRNLPLLFRTNLFCSPKLRSKLFSRSFGFNARKDLHYLEIKPTMNKQLLKRFGHRKFDNQQEEENRIKFSIRFAKPTTASAVGKGRTHIPPLVLRVIRVFYTASKSRTLITATSSLGSIAGFLVACDKLRVIRRGIIKRRSFHPRHRSIRSRFSGRMPGS